MASYTLAVIVGNAVTLLLGRDFSRLVSAKFPSSKVGDA